MNLEKLTIGKDNLNEVKDLVHDEDALGLIQSGSEPTFIITNGYKGNDSDDLVELEVSFRKGRRVGLFKE